MLLRMNTWDRIRHEFDETEKAVLNAAVTGETICPRGLTLDPKKLPSEMRVKLSRLIDPVDPLRQVTDLTGNYPD